MTHNHTMSDTIEENEAEASVLAELFSTTRRQSNLAILRAYRDAEVAERDRRIEELEAMLQKYVQACYDGGENLSALRNEELHAEASALVLAKSERSAP